MDNGSLKVCVRFGYDLAHFFFGTLRIKFVLLASFFKFNIQTLKSMYVYDFNTVSRANIMTLCQVVFLLVVSIKYKAYTTIKHNLVKI